MKSATHPSQVIARSGTAEAVCYDILGILGEGGSGVTYRARDPQTQQPVALKALSLSQMNDWKAIELFEREAKVLSTLDRDGIPKYLDYFTTDIDGDRYFYIVDRTKDMVIRGGFNVYPREVEEVMMQHPAVSMVAVIGIPDEQYGEEIKACVVLKAGQLVAESALIAWTKERLAMYKYPRHIEFMTSLPMNASGKILKTALRK